LYAFYKTLSGYVNKRPVSQDAYFDFKDRYQRALSRTYLMDHFIAEDYVLMWQNREQLLDKTEPWQSWTEDFMKVKDLDLTSVNIDTEEELDRYLQGYEGFGCAFGALAGWGEETYEVLKKLVWVLKYQSLILNVREDALFPRRYFPLLGSTLLSISEIELIRKPASFKELIEKTVNLGVGRMEAIEKEIFLLPKPYRPLLRTVLDALFSQARRIAHHPDALFTKPPSYFYFSHLGLSLKLTWHRLRVIFEEPPALKKEAN
jgi:phytoene/squalene synthetase